MLWRSEWTCCKPGPPGGRPLEGQLQDLETLLGEAPGACHRHLQVRAQNRTTPVLLSLPPWQISVPLSLPPYRFSVPVIVTCRCGPAAALPLWPWHS